MLITVMETVSRWAIPFLLLFIPLYGALRRVPVYESFVSGAEEGFTTAVKIIPFLLGMMVAIAVVQASGAMELLTGWLRPVFDAFGVPPEVLPLALLRPLSGSGALAMATELIAQYGPDSLIGRMASVMQGTTDTTFFVLTVYFGSVGIRHSRYALFTGLMADLTGLIAALYICRRLF